MPPKKATKTKKPSKKEEIEEEESDEEVTTKGKKGGKTTEKAKKTTTKKGKAEEHDDYEDEDDSAPKSKKKAGKAGGKAASKDKQDVYEKKKGSDKRTRKYDDEEDEEDATGGLKPSFRHLIRVIGRAEIDELFTEKNYQVLIKNGRVYSATLNQSDGNSDKFYIAQVLENTKKKGDFITYTRWGKTGANGQNASKTFKTADQAIKMFEDKVREKTVKGGYVEVDNPDDEGDDGGDDDEDDEDDENQLDEDNDEGDDDEEEIAGGQFPVDEYFTEKNCQVLVKNGKVYSTTLEQSDGDSNKFYVAQVLENTKKGVFFAYTRWGKIDTKGQSASKTFKTADQAIKMYEDKVHEKTVKGGYGEVKSFTVGDGDDSEDDFDSDDYDDLSDSEEGVDINKKFDLPTQTNFVESSAKVNNRSKRFRHGINDFTGARLTVREVAMLNFMNSVTDKKDWQKKIFDKNIVEKWRDEVSNTPLMDNDKTFDWCMEELREKAKLFEKTKFFRTLDHSSVCIVSDTLIDSNLQDELKKAVEPLLEKEDKDWHPKSDDKVLNLVHPSLYPLVYGRTKALKTGKVGFRDYTESFGKGETVEISGEIPDARCSKNFQWLPCEVNFVDKKGTKVEISSYINNLHPSQHEGLYSIVEKFISISIPLWNEVLIEGFQGRTPLRIIANSGEVGPEFPEWIDEYAEATPANNPELKKKLLKYFALPDKQNQITLQEPECKPPDGWEQEEAHEAAKWKHLRMIEAKHPEAGDGIEKSFTFKEWSEGENGTDYDPYTVSIEKKFRKQGLQVIVKLSSIELTPEKPTYDGGNWHLEGMMNEHIVATAIYYYDVQNTTTAKIRFRHEANFAVETLEYEQDQHEGICEVFGTSKMRDEPAVQEIGSITTPDGRLLVFPNTLQHRVDPFELADKSKAGHRRFLLLWLVDPYLRILSTANVPPQQRDWWSEETLKATNDKLSKKQLKTMSESDEKWLMDEEEAKELRLKLMAERTTFMDEVEAYFEEYNLCEH